MKQSHYPHLLPPELKSLTLNTVPSEALIKMCDDPKSLLYTSTKCEDPQFWKDRILSDFPIDTSQYETPPVRKTTKKTTNRARPKSLKEVRVPSKYDIFNHVNQYDPKWLYKVLYYFFKFFNKDPNEKYNDLDFILFETYRYLSDSDVEEVKPLIYVLMTNPVTAANVILRSHNREDSDIPGFIYTNFPEYRKLVLLSIILEFPASAEEFAEEYNVTETFSFVELAKLTNELNIDGYVLDDQYASDALSDNFIKQTTLINEQEHKQSGSKMSKEKSTVPKKKIEHEKEEPEEEPEEEEESE
jgi:hypothetical protein